jgi:hypothetical protein
MPNRFRKDWMPAIISSAIVGFYGYTLIWITLHPNAPNLELITERLHDGYDLMLLVVGYWLGSSNEKNKQVNK